MTSDGSGAGYSANTSSSDNPRSIGTETTNPGQTMLVIRRENLNIDLGPIYPSGKGQMTTIPITSMPRRLLLTANCYYYGGHTDNYMFSFIVDVLLVPRSFNPHSCFDLYHEPYNPEARGWYMGTRRLRDNIILLRRFTSAVKGDYLSYVS